MFVGDSTPGHWDTSIDYLLELRRLVTDADPTVGVVFQANKRDLPDAIGLGEIAMRLGDARWSIAVVESVASEGTGIREAFVYAVRLALDRVRDQMRSGTLPVGRPELATPDELLAMLRGDDAAVAPRVHVAAGGEIGSSLGDGVAAELFRGVLEAELGSARTRPLATASPTGGDDVPWPPDASVPSGAIWPPVEGRAILQDVSQLTLTVRALGNGTWISGLGTGWRIVSARDAAYATLDLGRAALIQWARLHAACSLVMSPRRCIVLAATGDGRWRLWQIVRAEESLRSAVERAVDEPTPDLMLHGLCTTAQLLIEVDDKLASAPFDLPCSLDTVGQSDAAGVYIGLMPDGASPRATGARPALLILDQELGPVLAHHLHGRRDQLAHAIARFPRRFVHADAVLSRLSQWIG